MAAQDRSTLKGYFTTGSKPTQDNFDDLVDSFALVSAVGSAGAFGLVWSGTATTAAAQDLIGTSFGVAMLQSNSTASSRSLLGVSTIGEGVFVAGTEASAQAAMGTEIGVDVQAYDADTLKADTTDNLTAGFTATAVDHGFVTSGTVTISAASGNLHAITNNGAFTLAVQAAENATYIVRILNSSGAGAVTVTDFSNVNGDTLNTTEANVFVGTVVVLASTKTLTWQAGQ